MKRKGGNLPESQPVKRQKTEKSWWDDEEQENSITKWKKLEHHGVIFMPEYVPHGIPLLYDGQPVTLTPRQEEVCMWWAAVVGTDWETNQNFRQNFQSQLQLEFQSDSVVKSLDKCDFTRMVEYLQQTREARRNRSTEEKKEERAQKAITDDNYGFAIIDDTKEKISNYVVEPPGLFRGRGQHPKAGVLKTRLTPEDVQINVGKQNVVPKCPLPGRAWKNVVHNDKVTWLAFYKDPNLPFSNVKYVYLSAASKFKGLNDKMKYEKARKLHQYIETIREDYTQKIRGSDDNKSQLGTALYLIDRLALRVGNEKTEDEADTVGCCSLRVEHVKLEPNNQITLDFFGKDSIRYFNTVTVDPMVWSNINRFTQGKKGEDELFDLINTSTLNSYLKSFMDGLSAKVFRTYNASVTLQKELSKFNNSLDYTMEEKVQFYTDANREVAILCNHQKSTPKNFEVQMEKMNDKLKEKLEFLDILEANVRFLVGQSKIKPNTEKKLPTNSTSARNQVSRLKNTIKNMEIKLKMKDDNKTVALGTSKINYMDPRITVAWCKSNEIPIEKIFPKTLRSKFIWAMYCEPDWQFQLNSQMDLHSISEDVQKQVNVFKQNNQKWDDKIAKHLLPVLSAQEYFHDQIQHIEELIHTVVERNDMVFQAKLQRRVNNAIDQVQALAKQLEMMVLGIESNAKVRGIVQEINYFEEQIKGLSRHKNNMKTNKISIQKQCSELEVLNNQQREYLKEIVKDNMQLNFIINDTNIGKLPPIIQRSESPLCLSLMKSGYNTQQDDFYSIQSEIKRIRNQQGLIKQLQGMFIQEQRKLEQLYQEGMNILYQDLIRCQSQPKFFQNGLAGSLYYELMYSQTQHKMKRTNSLQVNQNQLQSSLRQTVMHNMVENIKKYSKHLQIKKIKVTRDQFNKFSLLQIIGLVYVKKNILSKIFQSVFPANLLHISDIPDFSERHQTLFKISTPVPRPPRKRRLYPSRTSKRIRRISNMN